MSGIFNRLYQDGKKNDNAFYEIILNKAKELVSSNVTPANPPQDTNHSQLINNIPDGILCIIASCLSSIDILSKWICVNRRFAKIGYEPATHKGCDLTFCDYSQIAKYPPKFSLDSIVSLAKYCDYRICDSKKYRLFDCEILNFKF